MPSFPPEYRLFYCRNPQESIRLIDTVEQGVPNLIYKLQVPYKTLNPAEPFVWIVVE
jgi:hypothetical protein